MDFRLRVQANLNAGVRTLGTVFHFIDNMIFSSAGRSSQLVGWIPIQAGARIKVSVIASSNANGVRGDCSLQLVMIAN